MTQPSFVYKFCLGFSSCCSDKTLRKQNKTKQNQLKDEGLSLSSWFQMTVPSGGEGQESRKLKQLATSHWQPEAESSGHSHLLLSLLSPLYEVQDPMLGTVSPTVKMGLLTSMNLCLLTTKTIPPPTHQRPLLQSDSTFSQIDVTVNHHMYTDRK